MVFVDVDWIERNISFQNTCGLEIYEFSLLATTTATAGSSIVFFSCIGDLSGKYGQIGVATYQATFMDWNLPLFGVNSVTGRSIVIHRSDGSR